MNSRRNFLKLATMALVATALPNIEPEKITINTTSNAYEGIGVSGVERMRIYSSGNVGIGCINPSYELKLNV